MHFTQANPRPAEDAERAMADASVADSLEQPRSNSPPRSERAGQGSRVISVLASQVELHPMIGLEADTLRQRYEAEIERELKRLRRAQLPHDMPEVIADGQRHLAFSAVPTVIAARERAKENGTCRIAVLMRPSFDAGAFFEKRLERQTPVSAYEQARMLAVAKSEHGSLRKWMQANGLDQKTWDSKCSKLTKLNEIDEAIMSKVDPFTIGNVKDAGKVVDAWTDSSKRKAMLDVLQRETEGKNERVVAGPLFKMMLHAVTESSTGQTRTPAATLRVGSKPGYRDVVSSTGAHIATIRLEPNAGWESAYAVFKNTCWEEPINAADP